jgi:hypothetical protein
MDHISFAYNIFGEGEEERRFREGNLKELDSHNGASMSVKFHLRHLYDKLIEKTKNMIVTSGCDYFEIVGMRKCVHSLKL